jgi:hypothetical protein
VTDEVMVVALSVGACPGGALAALRGLLEQFDETLSKRVFTTKKGSDDPFSATSRRPPTVRERVQKSAVLRNVWRVTHAAHHMRIINLHKCQITHITQHKIYTK